MGVLVWLAAPELHWPARLLTAVLLGPAPIAFLMQAHAADDLPRPFPRMRVYAGSIAGLWLLAIIAVAAAATSGFTGRILGLNPLDKFVFLLWTAFGLLATTTVVLVFKALGARESDLIHQLTPVSRSEKLLFVLLSVSAGICEELTFRSVLLPALLVASGSLVLAVVLSSIAFGLLHAHQHASGAARAAVLGVILCIPFVLRGSVLPSMAAHTLIDLISGLWVSRYLLG